MNVKLEVGKEYWLSEQKISRGIYLGESNSGNFDFRITLGSKHTKPIGELDVMTSNLSVYSEYIPEKPWKFTTPISMKCTEEQFNGIKDKLVEMGYEEVCMSNWDEGDYIVNNLMKHIGSLSNIFDVDANEFGCIMVDTFNPDLFLALAAMTDKEYGIKGEVYTNSCGKFYTKDDEKEGKWHNTFWRKATAQEIIEHFEKKEFVLPDRWCVKVGGLNTNEIILKWRHENSKYKYYSGSKGYINYDGFFTKEPLYAEITFDQFKKYVLKETTQSCQIIPIPPSKQATLFDDRVEITDWKPKDNDEVLVVSINVDGWGFTKTKYKFVAEPYKAHGFIKRTESEAKQLVEKLKQAML